MTKQALKDLAARAGWTAAETFLAVFVVSDLSSWRSALVAAGATALSAAKSFVGAHVGPNKTTVEFV